MWNNNELEHIACDFCGNENSRLVVVRPDGLSVVECCECGLQFINPRPRTEEIYKLYDRDYFVKQNADARIGYHDDYSNEKNLKLNVETAQERLRVLSEHISVNGKKILELGCATGEFCLLAQQAGAQVVGADVSDEVLTIARQRYPTIKFIKQDALKLSIGEKFDVICAFEVIEHVVSPSLFIKELSEHLHTGGILALSTPNVQCAAMLGSEWLGYQISFEHLYFLDKKSVMNIAKKNGLELVEYYTAGGMPIQKTEQDRLKYSIKKIMKTLRLLNFVQRLRQRDPLPPHYVRHENFHNLFILFRKAQR